MQSKFAAFFIAAAAIYLMLVSGCGKKEADADAGAARAAQPAAAVVVEPIAKESVPIVYEYIAQTEAVHSVSIMPQVSGIITEANFVEGSVVAPGQKLFQIDPAPYQAAVLAAEANLAQTSATLKFDEAEMARIEILVRQNTMTQQDIEKARATRDVDFGKCMANNAALYQAQLNLGYTTIVAPFEGQIGAIKMTVGNLAMANSSQLATLVSQSPINATFRIPETEYLVFARKKVASGVEKLQDEGLREIAGVTVQMVLSDGTLMTENCTFNMLDNQVDSKTGTIAIRVSYPNSTKMVKPNQFCRIRLTMQVEALSMVIPQAAIMELQGNNSVYVVDTKNENVVKQHSVQVGERLGDSRAVILSGLTGDETIITDGLLKVRPGAKVMPMTPEQAKAAVGKAVAEAEQAVADKEAAAKDSADKKE